MRRTTTPSTWGTYEQALAAFEAGQCDGIGFNLLGTDIAAFDYDKCRDPATGDIAPEAMAYVDRATSYTEITVSGTGLRVIGYGNGSYVHRKQKLPGTEMRIESYSNAERYITIAGNPLPQTWPHIADIASEIDAVVAELDGLKNGHDKKFDFKSQPRQEEAKPQPEAKRTSSGRGHGRRLSGRRPDRTDRERASRHRKTGAPRFITPSAGLATTAGRPSASRPALPASRSFPSALRNGCAGKSPAACTGGRPRRVLRITPVATSSRTSPARSNKASKQPFELFWHGTKYDRALRSWLIKELIPETGQGLASGQWGMAKTFTVLDLAAEIMIGGIFAGRIVARKGGVIFVAAEGANEMPIRLEGLVEQKLRPVIS